MKHPLDEARGDWPHEGLDAAVDALQSLERMTPERPGTVRLSVDGGVAWILLDNPQAHNALTVRMMRELAQAVQAVADGEQAIVALASAHGGTFCAGGHLGQVRESLVDPQAARLMTDAMQGTLDTLLALPVLSVAVLEGAAIGGGVELASACDLRVGTADVFVHAAQVRLGVACGWGGASRLVQHLGRRGALRLLTRSERLDAVAASQLGFLDRVATGDRHQLLADLLGPTLSHPPDAIRAAKLQVAGADPAQAFLSVWGGPAHRAALDS